MKNMENGLQSLRRMTDQLLSDRRATLSAIEEEKETLQKANTQLEVTQEGQKFIQELAQQVQQKAHKQIARVVSRCLSAVFGGDYQLRIEFEKKRGKTEATFVYMKDGHRVNPHVDSGGVMEVTSLALRLASLVMTMPPARKLLVLDEPFRGLTDENLQKMAILLESLSAELGVQVIITTHDPQLQIGKVIHLEAPVGTPQVTQDERSPSETTRRSPKRDRGL